MNAHEASKEIMRRAYQTVVYLEDGCGDLVKVISISDLEDICNYVGDECESE